MHTKRAARIFLAAYVAVILYFMFCGFGRAGRFDSYQYSLVFSGIPLWLPKHFPVGLDILKIWIFSLGNVLAFIPFGVLIPLSLPGEKHAFWKSAGIFLCGITVLELLQMLSLLGSFDMEDIVINTLGFCIGGAAWKLAAGRRGIGRKAAVFCVCCAAFTLLAIAGSEILNPFFRGNG